MERQKSSPVAFHKGDADIAIRIQKSLRDSPWNVSNAKLARTISVWGDGDQIDLESQNSKTRSIVVRSRNVRGHRG